MDGRIVYQYLPTGKYYTYKEQSLYKFKKVLFKLRINKDIKVWESEEPKC